MAIGVLEGYAMPALGIPGDHTYVMTSNGSSYGCHGRSSGGTLICSGGGNVDQADCLATPSGNAGIGYGINGLCHQIANRILCPAGINVSVARLANSSIFAWGAYGLNPLVFPPRKYSPSKYPWPELATCNSTHIHP